MVLESSKSMGLHDPRHRLESAVKQWLHGVGEDTRVGLVIYDQHAELAVPLQSLPHGKRSLMIGLKRLDYRYDLSDIPAAVERALYELKTNVRDPRGGVIVLLTDGQIEAGKPTRDKQRSAWLREDLLPEVVSAGIKIFAIGFTENADFPLLRILARKTGGEYFRAPRTEDLQAVFDKIQRLIDAQGAGKAFAPEPESPPVARQDATSAPPSAAVSKRLAIAPLVLLSLAAMVVLIASMWALTRRDRRPWRQDPTATLKDISGGTGSASVSLGTGLVVLGRARGPLGGDTHYVVVNDPTVSRRHALIQFKDQHFWIMDQGSVNGTYVNGKRVVGQQPLKDGDRIKITEREFEFVLGEAEPVQPPSHETVLDDVALAANPPDGIEHPPSVPAEPSPSLAPHTPRGEYDLPWTGNPAGHYR